MQSTSDISLTTNTYAFVVYRNATTNFSMVMSCPSINPGGFVGDYSIRLETGILRGAGTNAPNEGDFGGGTYYVNG